MTVLTSLGLVLCGVATWSFAEYALHNWVGHLGKGKNHFSREHLMHHAKVHYFAPAWQKVVAALAVCAVMAPVAIWGLGVFYGMVYTLSFVAMYLTYEHVHLRAHTHPPTNRYSAWVRKHHFAHHFNSPKHNHGVTSNLWDRVFRTLKPVDKVRVPRKNAMVWLVNPDTDELWPEFEADYVLTGRRRKAEEPATGKSAVAA